MWKVLIKLIEKWAYRCEHNWVLEKEMKVYSLKDSKEMPTDVIVTYRCTKCCKFKQKEL